MKTCTALWLTLALLLPIAGCGGDDRSLETPAGTEGPDWGITLSAEDVSPTGLTLVISHTGGEPTGRLQYGVAYSLDCLEDQSWEPVPYVIDGTINWTLEAYEVSMEDSTEEEIRWEALYGSLAAGSYRLTKEFMDIRSPGDYDTRTFCAEFEID